MNRMFQMIAGGVAAAFLAMPVFGQSKLNLTDCATKVVNTPAAQAACKTDNDRRTECNKKSNPAECYRAATSTTKSTTTTATQPKPATPAPAPVAKPATPAPTAKSAPKPAVAALPLSCSGGLVNNKTVNFTSASALTNSYTSSANMTATSLTDATGECKARCAKTGEPAPCGWYTLVSWRIDTSADSKSRGQYTCYMKNDRGYKDAAKPVMEKGKNFGNAANGMFYTDAWTYPCAR